MFGIPGGAILPTYDALARGTSIRHVLARHEQGAGHMAEGFARASGRVGVALRDLRPGRDEPRDADRRRLDGLDAARLRHRPGALEPDRHRRVPGVRHHRHHDPDRQALVARAGRRASCRTRSRPRSTSPARGGAARSSSTFRATSRRPSSTSSIRTTIDLPGWRPAATRERQAGASGGAGDRRRAAARALRRRRDDQRRGVRRASLGSPSCGSCPSSRR